MKFAIALLPLVLLAGCSSPDSASPTPAATPAPAPSTGPAASEPAPTVAAPSGESAAAATASASGVVESVDATAKTVTIATDAVASLKWPAMTMTYQAPNVDLGTINKGDRVSFELTAVGMDGTITAIAHQ